MTAPAPLTPADCDLQDFPFMPLHVARLRDSDLASEEGPEACWYAVLLWAASWHQIPAASLPDNDAVLTKLIGLGRDVKTFLKHKAGAMRGFVKCSDGRLYHPVVAELARDGWERKLSQRWRAECARIKKHNQRNNSDLPAPTFDEFMSSLNGAPCPEVVPRDTPEKTPGQSLQGTETGTVVRKKGSEPNGSGGQPPLDGFDKTEVHPPPESPADPLKAVWRLGVALLTQRGGLTDPKARSLVGKWVRSHDPEYVRQAMQAAWDAGSRDPVSYVTRAIPNIEAENHNPMLRPDAFRQRLWMQDFRAFPNQWREHERGPRPGEPGCRVTAEIQAEYPDPKVVPIRQGVGA